MVRSSLVLAAITKAIGNVELRRRVRTLAEAYNTKMMDVEVWDLLHQQLSGVSPQRIAGWQSQYGGHEFASALIIGVDPGEATIKYHLLRRHLRAKGEVSLFEFVVDSNRLDYGRVNGHSYAYEIKTELDSLGRLEAQAQSYSRAFEFVTVVIDPRHLEATQRLLPETCGIETYSLSRGTCEFTPVRSPARCDMIDADTQIRNLSARDMEFLLRTIGASVPQYKADRTALLRRELSDADVNEMFKLAVKRKYAPSWSHVRTNFHRIQPVDIETFYHGQWDPTWVYFRSSTIE